MLENNQLYRRIQTNNLFKTFSRAYARQTAKLVSHKALTLGRTGTTQGLDRTNIRSCLDQRRADSLANITERDILKGETAPAFLRSQQPRDGQNSPFSQTLNITLLNTHSQVDSYSGNLYLNSSIARRKESDPFLWNKKQNKAKQNFKLKSCALKQKEHYEGPRDETDFSLLQLQSKNNIKKICIYRKKSYLPSCFRLEEMKKRREFKSANGGRVPAQLLSRYVTDTDSKSKIMSLSNQC